MFNQLIFLNKQILIEFIRKIKNNNFNTYQKINNT